MAQESNLVSHARFELNLINDGSPQQTMINEHLLDLIKLFSNFGHSGMSASYAIDMLTRLLRYEPLVDLTGETDEWVKIDDNLYQNRRCSRVFSETGTPDGPAFDVEGKVFLYPDGTYVTNSDSHVSVTFPYRPGRPEVVELEDPPEEND